jgi:hypothetical protein
VHLEEAAPVEEQLKTAPLFSFRLRNRLIQEGGTVKLICIVTGEPLPKVTWYKGDREIAPNSSDYIIEQTVGISSLEITNCALADAGRYSCKAENARGFDETNCNVAVEESRVKRSRMDMEKTNRRVSASVERLGGVDSRRKDKDIVTIKSSSKTTESISDGGRTKTRTEERSYSYKKIVSSDENDFAPTPSRKPAPIQDTVKETAPEPQPEAAEPAPEPKSAVSEPQPEPAATDAPVANNLDENANEPVANDAQPDANEVKSEPEPPADSAKQPEKEPPPPSGDALPVENGLPNQPNGENVDASAIEALQNALG